MVKLSKLKLDNGMNDTVVFANTKKKLNPNKLEKMKNVSKKVKLETELPVVHIRRSW